MGLPLVWRPQHEVRTIEDANLEYWQAAAREQGLEEIEVDGYMDDLESGSDEELSEIMDLLSDEGELLTYSSEIEAAVNNPEDEDNPYQEEGAGSQGTAPEERGSRDRQVQNVESTGSASVEHGALEEGNENGRSGNDG